MFPSVVLLGPYDAFHVGLNNLNVLGHDLLLVTESKICNYGTGACFDPDWI